MLHSCTGRAVACLKQADQFLAIASAELYDRLKNPLQVDKNTKVFG